MKRRKNQRTDMDVLAYVGAIFFVLGSIATLMVGSYYAAEEAVFDFAFGDPLFIWWTFVSLSGGVISVALVIWLILLVLELWHIVKTAARKC